MRPAERRVSEIMQTQVATLAPGEHLDLADDIMQLGRVRHMPVLDGQKLVGMVSQRDVLAASLTRILDFEPGHRRTFMRSVAIDEVMTRDVVTVGPEATLAEAAQRLVETRIGGLPVVDAAGNLVGLVTEVDLLRAAFLDDSIDVMPDQGGVMSELGDLLNEDIEALKRMRDELRVQVHLGAAEARDLWDQLEDKWRDLERRAVAVAREAEEPLHDVAQAAKDLVHEIRDGYRKVRDAL